ncbi:MAG: rhomboid family intramembrane serine protease [Pseudomonadota bacterium]
MIFPYGLDDGWLRRIPLVSIIVLLVSVLVHVGGALRQGDADPRVASSQLEEILGYWDQRQYLDLPDDVSAMLPAHLRDRVETLHARAESPGPTLQRDEQQLLDARCQVLRRSMDQNARRWGLIPAEGLLQVGWVSHLFVHADVWHLVGNMVLFALVAGPFLEEVWGILLFALLYLLGGVAAGGLHAAMTPSPGLPLIGASGAISACVGAFCFRFARRRVRFFYWILIRAGSFSLPAWVWGVFFFGQDVLYLLFRGEQSNVAFAAHVGGFGFGALFAIVVARTGLEQRLGPAAALAAALEVSPEDPSVVRGREALAHGELGTARLAFHDALHRDQRNVAAALGLIDTALAADDRSDATRWFEWLLDRCIGLDDSGAVSDYLFQYRDHLDLASVRPRIATALVQADPHLASLYGTLQAAPVVTGSPLPGSKAIVPPPPGPDHVLPQVRCCSFIGRDPAGLLCTGEGVAAFVLPLENVVAIALGIVAELTLGYEQRENVVITDIYVRRTTGELGILRFHSHVMGLRALFAPGTGALLAHRALVEELQAVSRARLLFPLAEANSGGFAPLFADLATFERASVQRVS